MFKSCKGTSRQPHLTEQKPWREQPVANRLLQKKLLGQRKGILACELDDGRDMYTIS